MRPRRRRWWRGWCATARAPGSPGRGRQAPARPFGPGYAATNVRSAMGQPIVVTEKETAKPGVWRFETNRVLTGMAHERYRAGKVIAGTRPPDELARRIFAI